jgi:hypothetical protein
VAEQVAEQVIGLIPAVVGLGLVAKAFEITAMQQPSLRLLSGEKLKAVA